MNTTNFLGFTNFIFEDKLWFIIGFNLLASFYAALRLTLGNFHI